jgi:glycosyltransferase involved in cell wall biosynthesis
MIWVGSIEERKSLDILLEALGTIKSNLWELTIIGGGPDKNASTVLANALGINDRITWAGKVSREDVNRFYREAHLHIVTSLLEGNPTVIWEAMAFGIPTLALDHFGMHDVVCEKCGQKVPTNSSMQSLIEGLANRIQNLLVNPDLIGQLSIGVLECSRNYLWSTRRTVWSKYYERAINIWQEKRRGT